MDNEKVIQTSEILISQTPANVNLQVTKTKSSSFYFK